MLIAIFLTKFYFLTISTATRYFENAVSIYIGLTNVQFIYFRDSRFELIILQETWNCKTRIRCCYTINIFLKYVAILHESRNEKGILDSYKRRY